MFTKNPVNFLKKFSMRALPSPKRLLLWLIGLATLVYLCLNILTRSDVRSCFLSPHEDSYNEGGDEDGFLELLEDVLLSSDKPVPGKSIFFHETSCHQKHSLWRDIWAIPSSEMPQKRLVALNARQACAIESAALHNPNFKVFLLFASAVYRKNTGHNAVDGGNIGEQESSLVKALLSYPNVYMRNLNLWTYAAGTPIYEWLKEGELFKSQYVSSHISDFLRYLTLYRWGGTYLDMDIILLRSLEEEAPNYTGAESSEDLAAGVLNFSPTGFGHDVAAMCLQDFQMNFNGKDWGNNGPGVITRVMQQVCDTKTIPKMVNNVKRCMGFRVYEREAFYAIRWRDWAHFFEPRYLEETMAATKNSVVVHVWNKHSRARNIKIGSNVAYEKLAQKHCPKVYASTGEYF